MKSILTSVTLAVTLNLLGCNNVGDGPTYESARDAAEPVTRTWSIYTRSCNRDALPVGECSEWQSEPVPSEEAINPVAADLGGWECHTLGVWELEDGTAQVTLSCRNGDAAPWIVTTHCGGEDSQTDVTLTDGGRYYEVEVLCQVE